MRYRFLLALLAACVVGVMSLAHSMADAQRESFAKALCSTDSECAAFCRKDDPECDGAPQ